MKTHNLPAEWHAAGESVVAVPEDLIWALHNARGLDRIAALISGLPVAEMKGWGRCRIMPLWRVNQVRFALEMIGDKPAGNGGEHTNGHSPA